MAYQDDTEMIARLIAERDYTKTLKNAAVEQLTIARQERDAARAQLASVIEDYQSRLVDAFNDTGKAVMERDATREELAIARKVMDKVADQRDAARAEAAEAGARECRAERARYSDAMTARLADVEAERDALRERCIEWLPFTEAAETIDSILVWREDAGTFVAFYDDDARCWFTERGEDLTGDLPAYYAKMPQGPTSK